MKVHATPSERFDRAEGSSPLRSDRAYYDPRWIKIEPDWNARDLSSPATLAHISSLEESILADGVREAIKVKYDRATGVRTLVAGHCRLTACLNLIAKGHDVKIPCEQVKGDEIELMIENLTQNAGLPLTQWEAGVEYRKLLRWGCTTADVARRVCKPLRYVTEAIALSSVSLEAKALLSTGAATPGAVLHAVDGKDGDSVEKLKAKVAERPKPKESPQTSFPGTPSPKAVKPKPVARPKRLSAKESIAKAAPPLLELADNLARMVVDEDQSIDKVIAAAREYLKARGI
jgi:ParB-like chromosome segregation protein Spo0J